MKGRHKEFRKTYEVFKRLGVHLDDANNGAYLPGNNTVKTVGDSPRAPHSVVHTKHYKNNVNKFLKDATSDKDLFRKLNKIRKQLYKNNTDLWEGKWKP